MRVVFLKEKEDGETVFAYFPDEVFDSKGNPACYAHIGQHSACSPSYASSCKQAKREEFSELLIELVNGVGYDDLDVVRKSKIFK